VSSQGSSYEPELELSSESESDIVRRLLLLYPCRCRTWCCCYVGVVSPDLAAATTALGEPLYAHHHVGWCLAPLPAAPWRRLAARARGGAAAAAAPVMASHASRMHAMRRRGRGQQQVANQLFSTYFCIVPNKNGQ
jgi:hypothetical protein